MKSTTRPSLAGIRRLMSSAGSGTQPGLGLDARAAPRPQSIPRDRPLQKAVLSSWLCSDAQLVLVIGLNHWSR